MPWGSKKGVDPGTKFRDDELEKSKDVKWTSISKASAPS
jgi:hypothetical protein